MGKVGLALARHVNPTLASFWTAESQEGHKTLKDITVCSILHAWAIGSCYCEWRGRDNLLYTGLGSWLWMANWVFGIWNLQCFSVAPLWSLKFRKHTEMISLYLQEDPYRRGDPQYGRYNGPNPGYREADRQPERPSSRTSQYSDRPNSR